MPWLNGILANSSVLLGVPMKPSKEEQSMRAVCLLIQRSPSSVPLLHPDHSASHALHSPSPVIDTELDPGSRFSGPDAHTSWLPIGNTVYG